MKSIAQEADRAQVTRGPDRRRADFTGHVVYTERRTLERRAVPDDEKTRHLELAAYHLYEAERATHPDWKNWYDAPETMRVDARYRIRSAHHRGDISIKAKLPLLLADVLAFAEGYVWPACDNINHHAHLPLEHQKAIVAERRQGYYHRAQLIVSALFNYLDVTAWGEPEQQRLEATQKFKALIEEDRAIVRTWKNVREGKVVRNGTEG